MLSLQCKVLFQIFPIGSNNPTSERSNARGAAKHDFFVASPVETNQVCKHENSILRNVVSSKPMIIVSTWTPHFSVSSRWVMVRTVPSNIRFKIAYMHMPWKLLKNNIGLYLGLEPKNWDGSPKQNPNNMSVVAKNALKCGTCDTAHVVCGMHIFTRLQTRTYLEEATEIWRLNPS